MLLLQVAMTLHLPLLYWFWFVEYCQTSPNKNKSPKLWHVTSILVCCIFGDSYLNNHKMKMKNCCCCIKIRTGSYIIAIVGLVIGVLAFISSSYSIIKNSERKYEDRLYATEVLLALVIGAAFFVIIQFLLLYGLRRNRVRIILFWLVIQAIYCSVRFCKRVEILFKKHSFNY